ncbi:MAG: mechanosensitive ion channel [SAR324 cluster bacterium]|nr:mechanosensitive ion channel [SAR324 cluster bacterium]
MNQEVIFNLGTVPVTYEKALYALLTAIIFILIAKISRFILSRLRDYPPFSFALNILPENFWYYSLIGLGMLSSTSVLGVEMNQFLWLASWFGLGLGFAARTYITNFISGIILLIERPCKIGDYIELESGSWGKVKAINTRHTHIWTVDNQDIIVPNSELINGRIVNRTYINRVRRMHIPFRVAYHSDKEQVQHVVIEAANQVKYTLKKKKTHQPQVWLVQFGLDELNFELIVWVQSQAPIQAAYLWAIETALRSHQIEIPFPQMDLALQQNNLSQSSASTVTSK